MSSVFAYTLLLVGMPVFVGMFVGSIVIAPVSRALPKSRHLEKTHIQIQEVINGLVTAVASIGLFRICELKPGLGAPAIVALWIPAYCFVSHQHMPNWLSWLGGFVVGWFVLWRAILSATA
jgi:hypothetical protein